MTIPAALHQRYHAWRIARLTARAAVLTEDQAYDLLFLCKQGFVRAWATGQSITRIHASVENRLRKRLRVVIRPGTYFVARGDYQNMVTRREYTIMLRPADTEDIALEAACINAGRPIPGTEARFSGVRRVSDDLARFLEAAQRSDPMTVQAGVWSITDGLSAGQVRQRLLVRANSGATRQAISEANIAEARSILNTMGIRHQL